MILSELLSCVLFVMRNCWSNDLKQFLVSVWSAEDFVRFWGLTRLSSWDSDRDIESTLMQECDNGPCRMALHLVNSLEFCLLCFEHFGTEERASTTYHLSGDFKDQGTGSIREPFFVLEVQRTLLDFLAKALLPLLDGQFGITTFGNHIRPSRSHSFLHTYLLEFCAKICPLDLLGDLSPKRFQMICKFVGSASRFLFDPSFQTNHQQCSRLWHSLTKHLFSSSASTRSALVRVITQIWYQYYLQTGTLKVIMEPCVFQVLQLTLVYSEDNNVNALDLLFDSFQHFGSGCDLDGIVLNKSFLGQLETLSCLMISFLRFNAAKHGAFGPYITDFRHDLGYHVENLLESLHRLEASPELEIRVLSILRDFFKGTGSHDKSACCISRILTLLSNSTCASDGEIDDLTLDLMKAHCLSCSSHHEKSNPPLPECALEILAEHDVLFFKHLERKPSLQLLNYCRSLQQHIVSLRKRMLDYESKKLQRSLPSFFFVVFCGSHFSTFLSRAYVFIAKPGTFPVDFVETLHLRYPGIEIELLDSERDVDETLAMSHEAESKILFVRVTPLPRTTRVYESQFHRMYGSGNIQDSFISKGFLDQFQFGKRFIRTRQTFPHLVDRIPIVSAGTIVD
jgi:hypothetical protein